MGILGEGYIHPLEEVEFRGESLRMNPYLISGPACINFSEDAGQ
jgi:hypothetical protein